ncbi:MAG: ABC-type polysaccharide/polyol phosphate export permease [Planctomycetota bacterium]
MRLAPGMNSNWKNLVARKTLLRELIATEVKASTAHTKLGWLWWLLDPLLMMMIYWMIVVELFGRGNDRYTPYWLFLFFGLITWKHVSTASAKAANLLKSKKGLIKAVAFPTLILPLASSITNFAFFLFGFAMLMVMAAFVTPAQHTGDLLPMLQIPFLMLLQLLIVAALSLPIACLGVVYRDFAGLVPHVLKIGFYLTPALYGADLIQEGLIKKFGDSGGMIAYHLYMLNPFAVLITGYRDALYYGRYMPPVFWLQLVLQATIFLWVGYRIYQHFDRRVIKFL